jgi:branched-chain amino acid transport system substrate-binding protein
MKEQRRRVWAWPLVVAALSVLALLTGGCGGDDRASGRDELKLAYLGPMTGDLASVGQAGRDAIQLAIDEANSRGDLPVRLDLEVFDTQLDPAQAQRLTADVISDSAVVGVIGPLSSGEVKAAAPTLNDAGMPFVTVASNPDLARHGWRVFHRLMANDDTQATEVAKYIAQVLNARAVAVIHDSTEYGRGLAMLTNAALQQHGVATTVDAIDPKAVDYSAAVNNVKARQPTVVFYGGYYPEAGRLVKQLRDAGVTATFVTGDAGKDPGIAQGAGRAAEGIVATCPCADPAHQPGPAAQAFAGAYQQRFGRPPALYSAEAYDGAALLIDAIRRGATSRDSVLKNLRTGRVQGVTKTFEFRPDGEVGAGPVYVYAFRGGTFTSLGTTADLTGRH